MSTAASLQKKWNRLCDVIWDDVGTEQDEREAGADDSAENRNTSHVSRTRAGSSPIEGQNTSNCSQPEAMATAETKAKKAGRRQGFLRFANAHRFDLAFIFMMGALLFFLAWILPLNGGPDEEMRYMIPQYIYRHGTLPHGGDPEIRNKLWGISYGFHPILPYIFGGYLMKLVAVFNSSEHALLMAARFINVLLGMGFYWYVLQISRRLFRRGIFRVYFVALLALLPQLLYLFVYVNTDGIALFSTAMILNYWLVGMERKWNQGSCTGLAIGVSCCALSYFNAYGFALMSVVLFVGSLIVFYGKRGAKDCMILILKRGLFITAIVFLLCGWWFIRCAVLYDGDFLGLYTPAKYGEKYAQEEYKPSVKKSVKEQGKSLEEMLKNEADGGMEWVTTTYRSTIGYFGFFEYPLGLDIYEIHKKLFILGILGMLVHIGLTGLWGIGALPGRKKASPALAKYRSGLARISGADYPAFTIENQELLPANFFILQFSLVCCIIIPVLLSLVYSYTDDFQPQGRYIMTFILPVMYFTAAGTKRVLTLCFRKWMVPLLMLPLLYAVVHVWAGAFLSVYIPVYCESLSFLSGLRFPWLSNIGPVVKLLQLLIPG